MNGDGEGRLDGDRDDGEPVKIIYKESRFLESDARNRFTEAERERENMNVKPQQRERGTTEGPRPGSLPWLISLQGLSLLPPLWLPLYLSDKIPSLA